MLREFLARGPNGIDQKGVAGSDRIFSEQIFAGICKQSHDCVGQ